MNDDKKIEELNDDDLDQAIGAGGFVARSVSSYNLELAASTINLAGLGTATPVNTHISPTKTSSGEKSAEEHKKKKKKK